MSLYVVNIENALHLAREHVFLSSSSLILLHYFIKWILSLWKPVHSNSNSVERFPRIYVSDSTWFDRLTDVLRMFTRAEEAVLAGYKKFPNRFFRISLPDSSYFVTGHKYIREICSASEDEFSFCDVVARDLQLRYTFSEGVATNFYHVSVTRNELSRHIPALMPDIVDELGAAMEDQIPRSDDWTPILAFEAITKIVSRISNRVFVGLPLCRNNEYLKHVVEHAVAVVPAAMIIRNVPSFLRPIIVHMFPGLRRGVIATKRFIGPIIEERRLLMRDPDYKKPIDFLQWLIDSAEGTEAATDALCMRIAVLNFSSIHTTSIAFSNALYDLSIHPEYVQPLREEIENIVAKEGWTKASVMKMRKLDSFLKESIRLHPLGQISSSRRAMKPHTFADGTTIPKGAIITLPIAAIQTDENFYPNGKEFDGFRFSKIREQQGESAKHHSSHTGTEFLHFGHGQHACPGRFFAVNEMKLMLAFTLLRYDVKTKDGKRPKEMKFHAFFIPDMNAEILFKRRAI